jgi:hypothetical protein
MRLPAPKAPLCGRQRQVSRSPFRLTSVVNLPAGRQVVTLNDTRRPKRASNYARRQPNIITNNLKKYVSANLNGQ